jgi:hypothetical protein
MGAPITALAAPVDALFCSVHPDEGVGVKGDGFDLHLKGWVGPDLGIAAGAMFRTLLARQ